MNAAPKPEEALDTAHTLAKGLAWVLLHACEDPARRAALPALVGAALEHIAIAVTLAAGAPSFMVQEATSEGCDPIDVALRAHPLAADIARHLNEAMHSKRGLSIDEKLRQACAALEALAICTASALAPVAVPLVVSASGDA